MQMGEYNIVKGEMADVANRKYFSIVDIDRNNDGYSYSRGEFKRDHLRWGLRVEDEYIKGMDASLGVTQWIIMDYDPAIVVEHQSHQHKSVPAQGVSAEIHGLRGCSASSS